MPKSTQFHAQCNAHALCDDVMVVDENTTTTTTHTHATHTLYCAQFYAPTPVTRARVIEAARMCYKLTNHKAHPKAMCLPCNVATKRTAYALHKPFHSQKPSTPTSSAPC